MRFVILGSGGALPTPLPGHQKRKQILPPRTGPGVFLRDANALFDVSLDIRHQLVRAHINRVNHLFISHWHPDHTEGIRILEMMNTNFLHPSFPNAPPLNVTRVHLSSETDRRHKVCINLLDYLVSTGVAEKSFFNSTVKLGEVTVKPITHGCMTYFLVSSSRKRVLIMMCELVDIQSLVLPPFDVLIIKMPWFGSSSLKLSSPLGHWRYGKDNFDDILAFIRRHRPLATYFLHIEDIWGLSSKKIKLLERRYQRENIIFCQDGLEIRV